MQVGETCQEQAPLKSGPKGIEFEPTPFHIVVNPIPNQIEL